ncbi:heavy metal sensor histidine kinase [Trinickia sp. EG282A]|uniref:heavy metal sensor histidine kinase n=1 Tax=Trinickia sp. EG282A TaxID=3237013 RepID=UPI0034D28315
MASRSLAATLALAFGGITLVVFGAVGSMLYYALDRQIKKEDDLDTVLISRHVRRLADELDSTASVREHAERLTSQVLGHRELSLHVVDSAGEVLVDHNAETLGTASPLPASMPDVPDDARITEQSIVEWHAPAGRPMHGIASQLRLRDGSTVTAIVSRDMTDRWQLLDHYRERLYAFGLGGMLVALGLGWMLSREALRPVRDIAASAATITVEKLDTRIDVENVPTELSALTQSLNAMLDRLHRGFERISQYTADLAHDMRTPLGNLRGSAEVALARERTVEEYQAVLASNLEECERLSRMIESVLFLARAEHPQFVTQLRELDAVEELTRIAQYFEGVADDGGIRLSVKGDASVKLRADVELMRRAINNLLANALRYTPPGKEIALEAARAEDGTRIVVANEGAPIDPALLERIFDRFYRADPARKSEPSSVGSAGLGLAIVRTIMELHGGTARAESDAAGTRFILTFPEGTATR